MSVVWSVYLYYYYYYYYYYYRAESLIHRDSLHSLTKT